MIKLIAVLVIALLLEAIGVVLLSRGLKQVGGLDEVSAPAIWSLVKRGVSNTDLVLGVALEAVFFGALLYLLSRHNVSLIWPLTSLGFVITALAARFVLGEEVTTVRWVGVGLIVVGAMLVSYGEKREDPSAPAPTPRTSERAAP